MHRQSRTTRRGQRNTRKSATLLVPSWPPWPSGTRIARPEWLHALQLHTHHALHASAAQAPGEPALPQELQRVTPLSIRLATHAQVGLAMRERYPVLRDISASIQTRRTVEESELALKLEEEFRADPCRKQCRPAQLQLFGRGWLKLGAA